MSEKMIWMLKKIGYRIFHRISKVTAPLFLKYDDPELLSGAGSLKKIAEKLHEKGIKKPLVVTDKGIIDAGLLNKMTDILKEDGIPFAVFEDVKPNPVIENIESGTQCFNREMCDAVIALGGGSSMDCAKIIAARAANPQTRVAQMRGYFKIKNKVPPIFAVPTTAGTGSEVSIGAIITDGATHEKFAIADNKLIPTIAVLDPEMTEGLPSHITATTGMDALTHAVEAYISINATSETVENAEKAIKIIFNDLEDVCRNGAHREKRENMAMAAFHAGVAMKCGLGYVHAISHNMSGLYGTPHGLANAIILPHVLDRSWRDSEKKLARLAQICGFGQSTELDESLSKRFIEVVRELNEKVGIPTKIDELKTADFDLIAERALKEANPVYAVPTIMNKEDIVDILRQLHNSDCRQDSRA